MIGHEHAYHLEADAGAATRPPRRESLALPGAGRGGGQQIAALLGRWRSGAAPSSVLGAR